jgi:hypothetical protein
MTSNFSRQQQEEIKKLFDVWSKPLENKILKLTYEHRKTKNELYKLKDSLVYRNMAARITMEPSRIQKSIEENNRLAPYLTRSGRKKRGRKGVWYDDDNSKVNQIKKSLHPLAHGKRKGDVSKQYAPLTNEVKKMHNRMLQAQEYRKNPQLKKKPIDMNGKTLRSHSSGNPYSPIGSKTNVGSLGRSTIVKTTSPMHTILQKKPEWIANRAATMSQKSGSSRGSGRR